LHDIDESRLTVGKTKTKAVGIPAVVNSLEISLQQMGPVRSVQRLLAVNQVDGFDCMGCARPEHGKRNTAEFCENGAKAVIAEEMKGMDHPDEAVFYTSGRTSNEAAFLYQLLVRGLGTNNLPDCSNMCHESSGSALVETIGIGMGSVSLLDVETASLIFVAGQNPGRNHPRMLSARNRRRRTGRASSPSTRSPRQGSCASRIHRRSPARSSAPS